MVGISFFSLKAAPTTEIYTLSLHDALPIYRRSLRAIERNLAAADPSLTTLFSTFTVLTQGEERGRAEKVKDRKSTRLNSSHSSISYAVFCLKKKKHMCGIDKLQQHFASDVA